MKQPDNAEKITINIEEFYRWSLSEWNNPRIEAEELFDISEIISIKKYDTLNASDNSRSSN